MALAAGCGTFSARTRPKPVGSSFGSDPMGWPAGSCWKVPGAAGRPDNKVIQNGSAVPVSPTKLATWRRVVTACGQSCASGSRPHRVRAVQSPPQPGQDHPAVQAPGRRPQPVRQSVPRHPRLALMRQAPCCLREKRLEDPHPSNIEPFRRVNRLTRRGNKSPSIGRPRSTGGGRRAS